MSTAFRLLSFCIVQWASSVLLSLLILVGAAASIVAIVDWGYVWLHPVAAYEEDLGYGLVMITALGICAVIAIPVLVLLV